jgi:hypothetical protein
MIKVLVITRHQQQKLISNTILDFYSSIYFVSVISNAQNAIMITSMQWGVYNYGEWIGSIAIRFHVGNVVLDKFSVERKISRSTFACIVCRFYAHSTSYGMFSACIYLGVHDHLVSNGTCRESLDTAYQCVANEVMKTLIAKNPTIVLAMSKHLLENYILKSPSNIEDHYLAGLPLKLGMDFVL